MEHIKFFQKERNEYQRDLKRNKIYQILLLISIAILLIGTQWHWVFASFALANIFFIKANEGLIHWLIDKIKEIDKEIDNEILNNL